jgi:uncharacterized protein
MSQTDIEILREGYEAFNRGDRGAVFGSAHPDIELITADRITSPGTYQGIEAVGTFFDDLFAPFEEVEAMPEKFFDTGDRIAVLLHVRLRPRGSSATLENRIGHLWTFREGKAIRFQIFPEREKALEAIGMSADQARAEAA